MILFFRDVMKRAFHNMHGNLFPNLITIGVIGISMLIFSAFSLIAFNLSAFLKIWEDKIEVLAYLKRETPLTEVEALLKKVRLLEGVEKVNYVSPFDAMAFMENRLGSQRNLLEGIKPAILPPSFEIQVRKDYRNTTRINEVVSRLKQFSQIEEIQYGQEWVETFSVLLHILRPTQWILGGVLLIAMIFLVSLTLQLTISSRWEEIEIMKMMGASPAFIQIPFYIEGMVQGLIGGGLAVLLLLLLHQVFFLNIPLPIQTWLAEIPILFLPWKTILWMILGAIFLGFFGSFVASVRFLKYRG
jgi:cell division transport system permease protein